MTISTEIRRAGPYAGNGATTTFAFAFKVFATSEVLVTRKVIATGVETVLALTSDYTVTLNSNQNANPGGTVTMLVAPPSGQSITITSNVLNLQPTAVANLGAFYPEVINDGLDRATMQIQQLDERLDRALVLPVSSTGVNTQLPPPQSSSLIGWDAGGTGLQNYNSVPLGTTAYQYVHRVAATAGQTVFTLPTPFVLNANAVTVFVNGLRLEQGVSQDWVETNTTTITFNNGLGAGDEVAFVVNLVASVIPVGAFPASGVSAFGATLIDDADAAAARTTLGLGGAFTWTSTQTFASADTNLSNAAPRLNWIETDAAADNGRWRAQANSGVWHLYAYNDAASVFTSALNVTRSGTTITEVEINATTLDFNGNCDVSGTLTRAGNTVYDAGNLPGSSITWTATQTFNALVTNTRAIVPVNNQLSALGQPGSEWSQIWIHNISASGEVIVGSPTGLGKGDGTINAQAVYDDNVLLTDYVFDQHLDGAIRPEDQPNADAVGFDPRWLDRVWVTAFWREHRRLPWMPSRKDFETSGKPAVGDLLNRLWAGQEIMATWLAEDAA